MGAVAAPGAAEVAEAATVTAETTAVTTVVMTAEIMTAEMTAEVGGAGITTAGAEALAGITTAGAKAGIFAPIYACVMRCVPVPARHDLANPFMSLVRHLQEIIVMQARCR